MQDLLYMQRAIELANRGIGMVSPNPMVGCVLVKDDRIIGEGWHQKYGQPHAEVNAIHSVESATLVENSTVYVNLEPCAHTGKTPPCTDLLIRSKVKKVVIANIDPNPLVAGKGIEKLKAAGIEVLTGVMEKQGEILNKRFFTLMRQKRPFIVLKWAETLDGFIARENFDSKWISTKLSRTWVHQWRHEEDAIMVGYRTVFYDNPKLNTRLYPGRNPLRVVFDKYLDLQKEPEKKYHLFDQSCNTIVFNFLENQHNPNLQFIKIDPEGSHLKQMLACLKQLNVGSIMIEGGSVLLEQFIKEDLWDEARVFTGQTKFERGIKAPVLPCKPKQRMQITEDELAFYFNSPRNV